MIAITWLKIALGSRHGMKKQECQVRKTEKKNCYLLKDLRAAIVLRRREIPHIPARIPMPVSGITPKGTAVGVVAVAVA